MGTPVFAEPARAFVVDLVGEERTGEDSSSTTDNLGRRYTLARVDGENI